MLDLLRRVLGRSSDQEAPDTPVGKRFKSMRRAGLNNVGYTMLRGPNHKGDNTTVEMMWHSDDAMAGLQIKVMLQVVHDRYQNNPEFRELIHAGMKAEVRERESGAGSREF